MKRYVIRKDSGNNRDAHYFLKRTNNGKWVVGRFKHAFIFNDTVTAQTIIDLFNETDVDPKPGEWCVVDYKTASNEYSDSLDHDKIKEQEMKYLQRCENLKKLSEYDLTEIRVMSEMVDACVIAEKYGISKKMVRDICSKSEELK